MAFDLSGNIMNPVPFFSRRSMAVTALAECLYFFGGVGASGKESILDVSADLWRYNTVTQKWQEIQRVGPWPGARRCVGFVTQDDRLLLWGGSGLRGDVCGQQAYSFLNDFWRFDPAIGTWNLLEPSEDNRVTPGDPSRPPPRYTPVVQSLRGRLFLFGGYTEDRLGKRKLNDLWFWSNGNWLEVAAEEPSGYYRGARWPGIRYGSMSAGDKRSVYVCGGFSDAGDHIDVWQFDMAEPSGAWRMLSPDGPREGPQARYCAGFALWERKLFMFGGRSRRFPKVNFNDLWIFDLETHRWEMIFDNRTPHRYDKFAEFPAYHAKSSSAVIGDHWFLWGGEGLCGHVSDFWVFDFRTLTWRLLSEARPDDPLFW
ncbi:MAG: hypothetical protein IPJ27_09580 [Candidatus Accumulibacter sp.]|uniref:Galactose oxidase n=1 Tax=Candidatus Accumulibacter proximus TaxID=2954385 RepID=A0A935PZZ3_9PROT|nr:hypothetical protein [Candidatus Accumulibacter proximus]